MMTHFDKNNAASKIIKCSSACREKMVYGISKSERNILGHVHE